MASEDVGKILENKEKLVKQLCYEAIKAHESDKNKLFVEKSADTEVIFSFPGSWGVKDWYSQEPFGAKEIDRGLFPSLRSIGVGEAAIVNEAFQAKFKLLMTKLQKRVNEVKDKKRIVFTGHSSGGPIAVLATIWFLEELAKEESAKHKADPLCVTFGSPLVGNRIFSQALRRENWSRFFVHFITRYDIVPRLFLSPFSSVEKQLPKVLEFIKPNAKNRSINEGDSEEFFFSVISNALTLTSHRACKLMESTNLLLETVMGFVELSCYRPFGNYVFFDESEKMVSLENSDAVLQFLFYSCQPGSNEEAKAIARKSLEDHSAYKTILEKTTKWKFYNGIDSDDVTAKALNDAAEKFELSPRGTLCLVAALGSEKQKQDNLQKINSKKGDIERALAEIDSYRRTCELHGVGHFDSFKLQLNHDDFKANVKRLELAGIWDEIMEMLKSDKLPDQFEGQKDWIELGTKFRRLVEPLDIANYYRHLKNEDTGPYMDNARPKRYRFTQRWLEHVKKASCGESSFWAEVEELCREKREGDFDTRAAELQANLLRWKERNVIEDGVFLSGSTSTFVQWWHSLPTKDERIRELVQRAEKRDNQQRA